MKTKSFRELIEKRLSKEEIAEIELKAAREVKIIRLYKRLLKVLTHRHRKKRDRIR